MRDNNPKKENVRRHIAEWMDSGTTLQLDVLMVYTKLFVSHTVYNLYRVVHVCESICRTLCPHVE